MDIFFIGVSGKEKRAFKGYFIIIFLCSRLKNKVVSKNKYSMHVFSKEFLLSHSFFSYLIVFHLIVRADKRMGVVKQRSDRCG